MPLQQFHHVVYTKTHTLYSMSALQASGMQWLSNGLVGLSELHTQRQHTTQKLLLQPGLYSHCSLQVVDRALKLFIWCVCVLIDIPRPADASRDLQEEQSYMYKNHVETRSSCIDSTGEQSVFCQSLQDEVFDETSRFYT